MEIRRAGAQDVHSCENVLRAAFEAYVRQLGREQAADAYSWLPDAIADKRVFVAVDTSGLQGVAITAQSESIWTIEQIAVRPGNQGQGIGSRLIRKVEQEAKDSGVLILALDTAERMTDLLRLYHKHGFEIVRKGLPKHGRDAFVRVYMEKAI